MSHLINEVWVDDIRERLESLRRAMPKELGDKLRRDAENKLANGEWEDLDVQLDAMLDYWYPEK